MSNPVTIGDITIDDDLRHLVWVSIGGLDESMSEDEKTAIRSRLHDTAIAEAVALGLV